MAGNQITEAGAKELAEALKTNSILKDLHLGGKCREDASIGTARGTERGMVCVSGCGGVVTSTHETLSGLTYVCVRKSVCVCLGGGERQHLTCMMALCVCVCACGRQPDLGCRRNSARGGAQDQLRPSNTQPL